MKKKKRFKVSADLRRYIKVIMLRMEIPNKFVRENDQWYCETVISGERFHKIVQRAKCEKKSKEDGILYLTYRESKDPLLSQALMDLFKCSSFAVINKSNQG